jgi:NH3-dependent NAD+ synthetase
LAALRSATPITLPVVSLFHEAFVLGNIKARERMIAQSAIAGAWRAC